MKDFFYFTKCCIILQPKDMFKESPPKDVMFKEYLHQ
jgi:hypothetical protein